MYTPYPRPPQAESRDGEDIVTVPESRVPWCQHNNDTCPVPSGIKSNGTFYRFCDRHRIRHNQEQRKHVHAKRTSRALRLHIMNASEGFDATAVRDDDAQMSDDESLFSLLDEAVATAPVIELFEFGSESDVGVFDCIDAALNMLETE